MQLIDLLNKMIAFADISKLKFLCYFESYKNTLNNKIKPSYTLVVI